jgi:hypothetical protein
MDESDEPDPPDELDALEERDPGSEARLVLLGGDCSGRR